MANVLVVGGAGYIGGATTDELITAGHNVRVYDGLFYEERYLKPVDFVFGDIRDTTRLRPHLDWADTVVWLAALVGDGACALNPQLTEALNTESVQWLVDNFNRRIVFMSTCSVYGDQDGVMEETSPTEPLSLYAKTKVEAEKIVADADAITFRLGTLFGLGDTYSRLRVDLVLNALTIKACLYGRISLYGGEQYRPLMHVRDVARAVVPNVASSHKGVFNLHTEHMMISELADRIVAQVPRVEIQRTELSHQDARNYRVSSDKARAAFQFAPQISVDDGIKEIKDLIQQGRIRDVNTARYSNADFLRPILTPESSPLGHEILPPSWDARKKIG